VKTPPSSEDNNPPERPNRSTLCSIMKIIFEAFPKTHPKAIPLSEDVEIETVTNKNNTEILLSLR
jgi:hypothetical protein